MNKHGAIREFESKEQADAAGYHYHLSRAERRKLEHVPQECRVSTLLFDRASKARRCAREKRKAARRARRQNRG